MTRILHRVSRSFVQGMTLVARHRTREYLLGLNDRLLADAGFSRALLESGVAAWPWRVESGTEHPVPDAVHSDVRSDASGSAFAQSGDVSRLNDVGQLGPAAGTGSLTTTPVIAAQVDGDPRQRNAA